MNLSALNTLISELGEKRCAEEFSALVDMAKHTSDPAILVQNPIYKAMLEDKLHDVTRTNYQQDKTASITVASS